MDQRKFMTAAPAMALPVLVSLSHGIDRSDALAVFRALTPEDQVLVLQIAQRLAGIPPLNLYAASMTIEAEPDQQS